MAFVDIRRKEVIDIIIGTAGSCATVRDWRIFLSMAIDISDLISNQMKYVPFYTENRTSTDWGP